MTPEQAKALLPLITALSEGKTIQRVSTLMNAGWVDLHDPDFSDEPSLYRVKPEPRELWGVYSPNGIFLLARPSKDDASDAVGLTKMVCQNFTLVHFREVA